MAQWVETIWRHIVNLEHMNCVYVDELEWPTSADDNTAVTTHAVIAVGYTNFVELHTNVSVGNAVLYVGSEEECNTFLARLKGKLKILKGD